MHENHKLVKMQEDDLIVVELDSRFDMSVFDPLGIANNQPIIIQQTACINNCVAGC